MSSINKPMENRQKYNEMALVKVINLFGYSRDYVIKCLRKDRKGIMPDQICKKYNELVLASKNAMEDCIK